MAVIEWYSPRNSFNAMISKNHITLGELAIEKLNSNYAMLGYDKNENVIAIKGVSKGEGFKITKRKINAKNFLNHFGIEAKGTYAVDFDEDQQSLLVKIK